MLILFFLGCIVGAYIGAWNTRRQSEDLKELSLTQTIVWIITNYTKNWFKDIKDKS
jgi:uncharacterized membrane protein YfcA